MDLSVIAVAALALVAELTGCSSPAGADRSAKGVVPVEAAASADPITYSNGACFGMCPIWSVTVTPNGGVFHGQAFTAVKGDRPFAFTAAQYRAFAARLARFRPHGERQIYDPNPDCGVAHTDDSSVEVRWGKTDHLALYLGCENPALQPMKNSLVEASALLPIAGFIGKR